MTPGLLITAGRALYGARFATDLAAALRVSDRTVRSWETGERHPRARVRAQLAALVSARIAELEDLLNELQEKN